jgi:hypothetical protein
VVAVGKGWTSAADCIKFWSTSCEDTELDKLELIRKMSKWCFKCTPPKG